MQLLIITHMSGPRDGGVMMIEVAESPPEVTFGRQPTCIVSLPDDLDVSRRHARLIWRDRGWWLEDLGSKNGTFVNEFAKQQKITGAIRIEAGSVFRVGLSRFRIESPDALGKPRMLKVEQAG
jgi:pSer/pThr/pTyr-binding forkhead associated (FHA) protein